MRFKIYCVLTCILIGALFSVPSLTSFAEPTESSSGNSGYLSAYQEAAAPSTGVSWWSTFAYLLSLLAVFLFVAMLAYLASKFLGNKLGALENGRSSKILEYLPLGAKQSVCAVEIAGKVILLGVTEQNITLLDEITDELEIGRLRSEAAEQTAGEQFPRIFEKQLLSLEKISRKFPAILNDRKNRK